MATLLDYRRRIRSVKSTRQITRAMKFVAAAKLRHAQDGVFAARPYAKEILRVLRSAAARLDPSEHPLLSPAEKKILVLVLTGDRSLCGAFNTNVIRRAVAFLREKSSQEILLLPIGKKGRNALKKGGWRFAGEYLNVSGNVDLATAKEIAGRIAQLFAQREVDAVYVVYNEFKNVLVHNLLIEKLLPVDPHVLRPEPWEQEPEPGERDREKVLPHDLYAAGAGRLVDYIYEQPFHEIFDSLVLRYVETQILRILLESSAAEWAARMTAMDAATRNASELIDKLTLEMNKVRQAGITKELIEIVSGAASATA
ncbi:MAG TPA: ATP synthase F1 subunit gamma [Candidatus Acidoferrales bacterium]|nr:ATP synthase F1 subunit gamma [Candidatus Acidoferrales bacterium]